MAGLISLLIGILFYFLLNSLITYMFKDKITVKNRLLELETGVSEERRIEGEFSQRVFEPILNRIANLFTLLVPIDEERTRELNDQLIQAGISLRAQQYRAAVVLFTLVTTLLLLLYGFITRQSTGMKILLVLLGLYTGVVLSRFHLKSSITKRRQRITGQFPSVMDLLSVCVTAGLGFDQAVSYIIKRMEGDIIDELRILLREISMGTPRYEALNRFAKRCGTHEIDVFVSALNQAEELGSPLANILDSQAKAVRQNYKQRTEEAAQKVAVKMILPMVLFMLPVVFIIILGPIVPAIMEGLGNV